MAPLQRLRRAEYYATASPFASTKRGYDRRMRMALTVLGLLVAAAGLVWVAQGLNLPFAPASFMTADRTWVVIGAVTALAGLILFGWARRRAG